MCAAAFTVQQFVRRNDIHAAQIRFGGDPDNLRDFVNLQDDGIGGNAEPLGYVGRAVCGMLYRDDAENISTSAKGLANNMTCNCDLFRAAGLMVSEEHGHHAAANTAGGFRNSPFVIEAAG